jgi:ADP-glucose pyrophosphorylase
MVCGADHVYRLDPVQLTGQHAILDKNVVILEGATVGVDKEQDRARGLTVSPGRRHRGRQRTSCSPMTRQQTARRAQ